MERWTCDAMPGASQTFELLTDRFKRAAMATNFGYVDEDKAMQLAGLRAIGRTVRALDLFGPNARNALVPLLDDPDPSVRVFAARYLLKVLPERALAALKDIEANATYEVRVTAGDVLRRHEHGKLDS